MQGLRNIYDNIRSSKERIAIFLVCLVMFIFGIYLMSTNTKTVTENGVEKKASAGKEALAAFLIVFGMAGVVYTAMARPSF
jgi:hypothetical protein